MEAEIIKWLVLSAFGIIGWFMQRTLTQHEEKLNSLEKTQQDHRDAFLLKEDFKEFKDELRHMFATIQTDIRKLQKID